MNNPFNFLMHIMLLLIIGISACSGDKKQKAEKSESDNEIDLLAAEALGWKLGAQAYTFNRFTFEEALDKIKSVGLTYVEAYPGQKLKPGSEANTHYNMSEETREQMKALINERGLVLLNYGVTGGRDENEWRQLFEFAKAMGIQTINTEPHPDQLNYIEEMANEFGINIALHNHPSPSGYYHPDSVLKYIDGRGSRMGACADIGHWVRSGLDPVECLKKLEGKVLSFHFKDLNEKSKDAHDVPWGQGVGKVDEVLEEMKRQGFKGMFSVEYEHNWDNNVPEVQESVNYFHKVATRLKP
ncbi:MAG: sugar phosphate isomerase/epimerase [Cyclobacteriaceae bacterium]|nr:sugar phosphate isomerase/epimerase [Cyclobacteriaceae bacterium]